MKNLRNALAAMVCILLTAASSVSAFASGSAPVYDSTGPVFILPTVIICLAVAAAIFFILKRRK